MPFSRPSPQAIRDRMAAEVEAALPGADARRRRSLGEIMVRAVAVASHEMHGHLAWAAKQILADSAEKEFLERRASLYAITRIGAAAATGPVTFAGSIGAVLPAGAEMR
ncbi:MAG: baseplate J/gp47 family protein, partial [Roseomonas sp.]|nr:baseplate J/gp47 family protein [Roseomonas sp.]